MMAVNKFTVPVLFEMFSQINLDVAADEIVPLSDTDFYADQIFNLLEAKYGAAVNHSDLREKAAGLAEALASYKPPRTPKAKKAPSQAAADTALWASAAKAKKAPAAPKAPVVKAPAPKAKKAPKALPAALDPIQIIYAVAERHGVDCVDVLRIPHLAAETKLHASQLIRSNALQAEAIRREKMEAIQTRLKARNEKIRPTLAPSEQVAAEPAAPSRSSGKDEPTARQTLEGFAMTAVLRALGKAGWKFEETRTALAALGLTPADGTIRAQLLAGRQGTRGEPANLSQKTLAQLEAVRPAAA
jgi:hypothetical protein